MHYFTTMRLSFKLSLALLCNYNNWSVLKIKSTQDFQEMYYIYNKCTVNRIKHTSYSLYGLLPWIFLLPFYTAVAVYRCWFLYENSIVYYFILVLLAQVKFFSCCHCSIGVHVKSQRLLYLPFECLEFLGANLNSAWGISVGMWWGVAVWSNQVQQNQWRVRRCGLWWITRVQRNLKYLMKPKLQAVYHILLLKKIPPYDNDFWR